MNPDFVLHLVIAVAGIVGSAAAAYAAIKGDLTRAIVLAKSAKETASEAHTRIDHLLQHHH